MTPEQDTPQCPGCRSNAAVELAGSREADPASLASWWCRACNGWLSFLAGERDALEGAKLLEFLADGPASLDTLAFERGLSVDEAAALLLALETRREVRRLPGDRYELAPKGGTAGAAPLAGTHPFDKAEQPPPADQSRRGRRRKGAGGE